MVYGTTDAFADWLSENGHALPGTAPAASVLLARASAYIDGTYGARFSGVPTGGFDQSLAWPRTGASAYGQPVPVHAIPDAVVRAAYTAAWQEASVPGSLSAFGTLATQIKRVKAGPAEVEYQSSAGDVAQTLTPILTAVDGLLAPFLAVPVSMPAILVV